MTLPETSAQRIAAFIAKWSPGGAAHALNEEQGAQQHFVELCAVLGVASPAGDDDYLFEKGALLHGQRRGYADVFKRGCFAWENKAPGKPLDAALRQLMGYALALDNPPLLIVSDRLRFEIHTHFNGTPSECHRVELAELADPARRELLRRCFEDGALIPADLPPQTRVHAAAIASAAKRLNDLRERWLNPPEWTRREPEVVPLGMDRSPYPDRIVPREGFDRQLAQRTLTRLYNERPAWLAQAHETLDAAVAAAYGWADYSAQMADDEILRRLLALNRERAAQRPGGR